MNEAEDKIGRPVGRRENPRRRSGGAVVAAALILLGIPVSFDYSVAATGRLFVLIGVISGLVGYFGKARSRS